jgi:hypothetical protein
MLCCACLCILSTIIAAAAAAVAPCAQVRVEFDQPGQPRRVKQSGKWLSQNVLTKSKKK